MRDILNDVVDGVCVAVLVVLALLVLAGLSSPVPGPSQSVDDGWRR